MRAIYSTLKPRGRHCYFVIGTDGALSDRERERLALRDGNDYVESPIPYDTLMEQAGFVDFSMIDVSAEYAETLRAWKRAMLADADAFKDLLGEEQFERRLQNRTYDIEHVEDGLTRRWRCSGAKP